MHGRRALLVAIGALSVLAGGAPADGQALHIRQDQPPPSQPPLSSQVQASSALPASSAPPDSSAPPATTSTPTPTDSTAATSDASSTPAPTSATSSISSSASSLRSSASLSSSALPTASNGTATNYDPQLPIQPHITPALGIAGVIMIISGTVYTIIGVKNKWLHISFSVCYLVALSIVVLIDYVANPPISNALQGAYFVAAFLPGCIIGGASLIFKDIVEGMGCMLGGFCFGMWIMTLKSGGISDSMGVRIGVICGLAAAAFSLSFSHHTREPGLIACLSFAGATVIILGVDMLTRAGLTYFWLYVWDLNDKLFPLGTKTYPMTRGIKVEIAAIVIIAVGGAMSQMRLWKIIKEKREKRAEQRARDEEERAALDDERNREFTEQHKVDRKQWERDFGNKDMSDTMSAFSQSQVDSGVHDSTYASNVSFKKPPVSVKDVNRDGIEMNDIGAGSRRSSQGTTSTRGHSKEKGHFTSSEPLPDGHRPKQSNPETLKALEKISEKPGRNFSAGSQSEESLISDPSGPEVRPLPFKVPTDEEGKEVNAGDDDDVKSIATAGESVTLDEIFHSGSKDKGPLAGRRLKRASGPSMGFDIPHIDDARSSLAATLDGISSHGGSLPALSRSGTPLPNMDDEEADGGMQYTLHQRNQSAGDLAAQVAKAGDADGAKDADANRRHSMHLPSDKPQSNLGSLANLPKPDRPKSEINGPAIVATHARTNSVGTDTKKENKPAALTKAVLPEGQSSTVGLYRTNEWAKHQALAETPEYDELAPPSEPGVAVEYGKEVAAPVNVRSLSQTAFAPSATKAKKNSSKNPHRNRPEANRTSSGQSTSTHARTSAGPAVPVYSSFNSYSSTKRSPTSPTASNSNLNMRASSSSNMLNQVPESPSQTSVVAPLTVPKTRSSQNLLKPSQNPQTKDNLIRLREDKLKSRMSTMSFAVPEAPTSIVDTAGLSSDKSSNGAVTPTQAAMPTATATQSNLALVQEEGGEDVPLAQRRATLKEKRASSAQSSSHYQLGRAPSNPYHMSMNSSVVGNTMSAANAGAGGRPYDAHQPQRGSTMDPATRESRLASWRASMAPAASPAQPVAPSQKLEANRQYLLESQRKQGEEMRRRESERKVKEGVMDQKMRSADIAELHRKKMRELQRQASQT